MNHWRIFYAGAVVRLVHCGDLLCDPVPVLESMCADRKRRIHSQRKYQNVSNISHFAFFALSCGCRNCFLTICCSIIESIFYDPPVFTFGHDICL